MRISLIWRDYYKGTDTTIEKTFKPHSDVTITSVSIALSSTNIFDRAPEVRAIIVSPTGDVYTTLFNTRCSGNQPVVWRGMESLKAGWELQLRMITPVAATHTVSFVVGYMPGLVNIVTAHMQSNVSGALQFPFVGTPLIQAATKTLVAGDNSQSVTTPSTAMFAIVLSTIENPDTSSRNLSLEIADASGNLVWFREAAVASGKYATIPFYRSWIGPLFNGYTVTLRWRGMTGGNTADWAVQFATFDA